MKGPPISFRSIEAAQVEEIHRRQNGDCREELSGWLDYDLPWAPMSLDQVKEKIGEQRKQKRTALLAVFAESGEFVGLAFHTTDWDPLVPFVNVLIWPEHRRKGYGAEAARRLLAASFDEGPALAVNAYVPEANAAGVAFAERLGLRLAGRERRAHMRDGTYSDGLHFDMVRREYLAAKGAH